MKKKPTNEIYYKHFSKEELFELINNELLDNVDFIRHCQETSELLKVDTTVVQDVIIDYSVQVLYTLQDRALKKSKTKINIFGFSSFEIYRKNNLVKFKKL